RRVLVGSRPALDEPVVAHDREQLGRLRVVDAGQGPGDGGAVDDDALAWEAAELAGVLGGAVLGEGGEGRVAERAAADAGVVLAVDAAAYGDLLAGGGDEAAGGAEGLLG